MDSERENERGARPDQKVAYPVRKMGLGVKKKCPGNMRRLQGRRIGGDDLLISGI